VSHSVAEEEMLTLKTLGHQVTVFSVWGDQIDDSRIPNGFEGMVFSIEKKLSFSLLLSVVVICLQAPFNSLRFILYARKHIGFTLSLISLNTARVLKSLRVERIHAHFASTNAIRGMLLAELLNLPFSCTGHGSDILLYPLPSLSDIIMKSHPFITISQYNKNKLIESYNGLARNIKVVHCGVNLSKFVPKDGVNREPPIILSVTWLRKVKGVEYLIDACEILINKAIDFKCIIVGGGYLAQKIKQLIEEKSLNKFVQLKGPLPHEQVIKLYQKGDIFVLPSLSEGIPIVLMEAMAMQLPVVATRITGIPELVTDGENGFLAAPRDPRTIANKIERLLNDPELRNQMGKKAREKVTVDFNIEKNVRLLEKLFLQSQDVI